MPKYKIGLDFGTTNSIISYWEKDQLEAFQYGGENGTKYIPSFITYEDGFIEIGSGAGQPQPTIPKLPATVILKWIYP